MPAVKIKKFLGMAPKISEELLPDTVADIASGVKLYSGDLIPYNKPASVATLVKTGPIKSIYPMDDGAGGYKWLHWATDVDVASPPLASNTSQRIIYTGDNEPRITNYSMATTGAGTAYPYAYYTLGLPAPLTAPTASAVSFTSKTTATRSRDSGNTARLTFSTAHGLYTGAYVTVTGLGGTGYNLTNVQITVDSSTSFTYYSTGSSEASTADTAGSVTLGGLTQTRNYVYTWYTEWGEESVPSEASGTLYLKEGQVVTVSGLPTTWPVSYTGTYNSGASAMKVRIYRTVPSSQGTYYFRVGEKTLAELATASGVFTDDIDVSTLANTLQSQDYDQPAAAMIGVRSIHNGIIMGFYDNVLCLSEPSQPHAWPIKYRINLDSNIVAVGNFGTSIIVATEKNPWIIQGSHPANMQKLRMDYVLPCVSKRSMVNMGYGVTYATPQGLAVYSSQVGGTMLTKYVHDWDTWSTDVDYVNLLGSFYNDKYFGTHPTGGFIFQRDDQVGGYLVEISYAPTALHYVEATASLYFVVGDTVYLWDDPDETYDYFDWLSKTIVTKDYINLGAARIVADYADDANTIAQVAQNNATLAANLVYITTGTTDGGLNSSSYNTQTFNGSNIKPLIDLAGAITFALYVDKKVVFTRQVYDSSIFRLPTGYRSDTFAVRLSGFKRVRAIHLGETPLGLKEA